jgi:cytochrome P450
MTVNDSVFTDLDFFVAGDPHPVWRELRNSDPVHWTERRNGRGFWSITKYNDAQRVYRDPGSFSSQAGIALGFAYAMESNAPQMQLAR